MSDRYRLQPVYYIGFSQCSIGFTACCLYSQCTLGFTEWHHESVHYIAFIGQGLASVYTGLRCLLSSLISLFSHCNTVIGFTDCCLSPVSQLHTFFFFQSSNGLHLFIDTACLPLAYG